MSIRNPIVVVVISLVSLAISVTFYMQDYNEAMRDEYEAAVKKAGPRPSEWLTIESDTIAVGEPVLSFVEFPHWTFKWRYATRTEAMAFRAGEKWKPNWSHTSNGEKKKP